MKKLYRRHCGGLAESMRTVREVSGLKEILDYENKVMEDNGFESRHYDSIRTEYYSDDSKRLGRKWKKEYVVLLHSEGMWAGIGFCNFDGYETGTTLISKLRLLSDSVHKLVHDIADSLCLR